MLSKRKKTLAINKSKKHDTDTGSPEVQATLLSKRIDELSDHLKKNPKDKHSRKGLLGLVSKRRAHLKYLKNKSIKRYNDLVKMLGLKK